MKTVIHNRDDFTHPEDGWYQIEKFGTFVNARAGITQIIDDKAGQSIESAFNREASKPGFAGMLIDIEHFKHDESKETRAYGWLMKLENRADGIYGQIRWTAIGQKAVDGGEYRWFSSEYNPKEMERVNGNSKQLRPMKLIGLTLTNVPNNSGQKPITNRNMTTQSSIQPSPASDAAASKRAQAWELFEPCLDAVRNARTPAGHRAAEVLNRRCAALWREVGEDEFVVSHARAAEEQAAAAEGKSPPPFNRAALLRGGRATIVNRQDDDSLSVPQRDLHRDTLDRAAQTGRKYADVRNELMTSRPAEYGIINRHRSGDRSGDAATILIACNREIAAAIQIVMNQNPAIGYEAAKAKAKEEKPQLFRFDEAVGDLDEIQVQRLERDDAVRRHMVTNRCSHSDAWDAVRRRRPDLFGIATIAA